MFVLMESLTNEELLMNLFYDMEEGFLPAQKLYKKAKQVRQGITLQEVQAWYKKQERQQKKGYKFYNSYVANAPLDEFQIDIADFSYLGPEPAHRYLFVCINIFSKYAHAIPLKTKTADETSHALEKVLDKLGAPKEI